MFQLNKTEFEQMKSDLIFQNGTSSWGGTRKLPYAFTEQGLAMLSGVLNSDIAIEVNISIMRAFVALRKVGSVVRKAPSSMPSAPPSPSYRPSPPTASPAVPSVSYSLMPRMTTLKVTTSDFQFPLPILCHYVKDLVSLI